MDCGMCVCVFLIRLDFLNQCSKYLVVIPVSLPSLHILSLCLSVFCFGKKLRHSNVVNVSVLQAG